MTGFKRRMKSIAFVIIYYRRRPSGILPTQRPPEQRTCLVVVFVVVGEFPHQGPRLAPFVGDKQSQTTKQTNQPTNERSDCFIRDGQGRRHHQGNNL